ncbi:YihY/virulence factor BrkB family protein [uncultured Jatrophihabitans sp.]|uniref:YihY/virulence factor BrkB family protein n=1 Tax=uncultured Jatrophihabitans sp. TaxID=1610747 RepID=UPI0035CC5A65
MHWVVRALRAVPYVPGLVRRAVVKGWQDRLLGLSAEAAFWQLLSLPSLFLALIATLGYVSRWFGSGTVDRTEREIEQTLSRAFSPQVVDQVIRPTLREVLHGDRADIISIGFVLALWAGSSATATFVNTIAIAYDMRDLRGPIRSRLLALGLFLGTVVLGVFLLPMLVLGPDLLRRAFPPGARHTVSSLIDAGYYPALVLLLLLGLTTFYKLAPPRRLPWHRGLPGAVLALLVFLGGSAGLRAYISFILNRNHAYGTLAAPIAALLFFFVLALGVLLGAEFNAELEHRKPAKRKTPRVLAPRNWQVFHGDGVSGDGASTVPSSEQKRRTGLRPHLPALARRAEGEPAQERKLS